MPLDDEALALIDRIVEPARPASRCRIPGPAGWRVPVHPPRQARVRAGAPRRARPLRERAGLPHVTPHQLRHTYATALVNAGCRCKH